MLDAGMLDAMRAHAVPLEDTACSDAILEAIGDARLVLLGEATHGTHEFYRMRAEITKRLIREKNFAALAVECDWPDALTVSRFIQGREPSPSPNLAEGAATALGGYARFPRWMWRNADVLELVEWLRKHNDGMADAAGKAGFFGLDLYSLRASMDAVVQYLASVDPDAAQRARTRYACFDHLAIDPQQYGYATTFGMRPDCELEVTRQLVGLSANRERYAQHDGIAGFDEAFYAEQNARVAKNAENYYRAMFYGRDESWNLRDTHMADTLDALSAHLEKRRGAPAKIVVWAHNSHIGDARATEMGEHGQLNLGQLVRERHGEDATFLLGFTTYTGTVTAASEWDNPAELKKVLPARSDSFEAVLHELGMPQLLLPIRGRAALANHLASRRLERAIGVIYLPRSERLSHYFYTDLSRQFDALIHIDKTRALKPLDALSEITQEEVPETYPSGI